MYAVKLTNVLILLLIFNGKSTKAILEKVCEDDTLRLQCENGGFLRIQFANYGRTDIDTCSNSGGVTDCVEENSLGIVKKECEHRNSCSVKASNSVFGDPCVKVGKYLEVEYECVYREIRCEHKTLTLKCKNERALKIIYANYGRTVSGKEICPYSGFTEDRTDCIDDNSLNIVKNKCESRNSCSINGSNTVFGDPCANTFKYLEVVYSCVYNREIACEHNTINLKCKNERALKIIDTNYGRTVSGKEICPYSGITEDRTDCIDDNSLNIVKNKCEGRNSCSINGSNTVFGDPCVNTFKYLEVVYDCVYNREIACEHNTVTLKCFPGRALKLIYVNYGRTVRGKEICPYSGFTEDRTDCIDDNSLNIVKNKCEGRNSCSINGSNTVFGDPCVNTFKYLEVVYDCVYNREIACEQKTLTLKCITGRALKIIYANYGRTVSEKEICPYRGTVDTIDRTNCIDDNSLNIVKNKCEDKNSCSIHASNSVFGDPCTYTFKYLEVVYGCVLPTLPTCGQRFVQQSFKIVGGVDALYGAYPWQAGIRIKERHFCGGTIINDQWIISAAHCFDPEDKEDIHVRVGDWNKEKPDQYEQEFEVEELYIHESYDEDTLDYDIALLKLKPNAQGKIQFSEKVQPACLPSPNEVYNKGTMCMISGWGTTSHGSENLPSHLQAAVVPLMLNTQCKQLYASREEVTDNMVCAGYEEGKIDTCQGDSGGPLVCEINGKHTLMGVTSWGIGCALSSYPGVYARVTQFLTWLHNKLQARQGLKSRGMPRLSDSMPRLSDSMPILSDSINRNTKKPKNRKNPGNTKKPKKTKNPGNTKKPKKTKNPKNKKNRKNKKKN